MLQLIKNAQLRLALSVLPKSFFAGSETFFDKSKARSRRFQNSPLGLKQLEPLFFHFILAPYENDPEKYFT
jgi:hypothetical protein